MGLQQREDPYGIENAAGQVCDSGGRGVQFLIQVGVQRNGGRSNYKISLGQTVNCVVVKATRGDKNWYAACLIFGNTRADVNGLVRRHLGARKASFAPMEEAVALTRMEYGGITPVGLPSDWPILIDKAVADSTEVVIGSGIRKSKLIVTGKFLADLPNAVILEGLGVVKSEINGLI